MSNNDPIKIRIGGLRQTRNCTACGKSSKKEQKEFYDVKIGDEIIHLCYDCLDMLFVKTLKVQVAYQGKLKTPNKKIKR